MVRTEANNDLIQTGVPGTNTASWGRARFGGPGIEAHQPYPSLQKEARPMSDADIRALTGELEGLRGIRRVLVETRDGQIKTIHVESDLSRRAKTISADIQSTLALMGIQLDYKKISIVEPKETRNEPVPLAAPASRPHRIVLKQVLSTTGPGGEVRATCVLRFKAHDISGIFSGRGGSMEEAVVSCMLNAFQPLLAPHVLSVEAVKTDLSLNTVGVVLCLSYADKRKESLTGMVKISDGDVVTAAAKAFLAATNRRVEVLLN